MIGKNTNLMYKRIRNICGFLGMILPWISIVSILFIKDRPSGSFKSISCTYYQSPVLAAILTSACIVLITYDGYSKIDNIITTLSGVFGFGIILFPCGVNFDFVDPSAVGFFQIPMNVSDKLHSICAITFFALLAYNSFFLFTKGSENPTKQKKIRNFIYRGCAIGMVIGSIVCSLLNKFTDIPNMTMIMEIILLQFFGISWLTKGEVFFKDK